jgi:hypothetical protein
MGHELTDAPRDLAGGILRDLGLLRERLAQTLKASAAMTADVQWLCAKSRVVCQTAERDRVQWHAWRTGMDELRRRSANRPERRVLRVCVGCDAVCFAPAHADGDAAPGERWIEPPMHIRELLRTGWHGTSIRHGLCQRCAPVLRLEIDAPRSATDEIVRALAAIEDASASVAPAPWLDDDAALDQALGAAVEELTRALPAAELRALLDALRALVQQLRGAPPPGPDAAPSRAASRFRPPLRRV